MPGYNREFLLKALKSFIENLKIIIVYIQRMFLFVVVFVASLPGLKVKIKEGKIKFDTFIFLPEWFFCWKFHTCSSSDLKFIWWYMIETFCKTSFDLFQLNANNMKLVIPWWISFCFAVLSIEFKLEIYWHNPSVYWNISQIYILSFIDCIQSDNESKASHKYESDFMEMNQCSFQGCLQCFSHRT